MGEVEFAGFEVGVEFGVGGVLLLVEDGANSEEVSWVDNCGELGVSCCWVGG